MAADPRTIAGKPWVQWDHIDGPLLKLSNGQLHWLTWRERVGLWLGEASVEELDRSILEQQP